MAVGASIRMAMAAMVVSPLAVLASCSSITRPPTAVDIAGLTPSGHVQLTETFVVALGGGEGTLTYQGQSYPFRMIGTVVGPSASLDQIKVSGDVYKLNGVSDFGGAYAQSNGPPGLNTSQTGDLWLQNKAGVVMHLTGTSTGATLSLGRDEVFVQLES